MLDSTTSIRARSRPTVRARTGALAPAVLVAAFALAAVVLVRYALRVHSFQPDEYIYVTEGRRIAQDVGSIFNGAYFLPTGIARLNAIAGAVTQWLLPNDAALPGHKVVNAVGYASTVFPVYLIARGIGVRAGWAVLAAAGAVAIAWIPLTTSLLTEPLTYAVFAWAIWAIWRAAVRPGWRADLVAVALVALAALGRANMIVLAAVLLATVLLQELRYGRRELGWRAALTRHWVIGAAVVAGLVWLAARGTGSFAGAYPVTVAPAPDVVLSKSRDFLRMLGQGLSVLPLMLGWAWILRHLVRPLDARRHAFALVGVLSAAGVLYSLNEAVLDERLVIYLAWVPILAAVAGLTLRDITVPAVAVTSVLTAWLVASHTAPQDFGGYAAFAHPGEQWWSRVMVGQAAVHLPGPFGRHPAVSLVIALAVVAIAAVVLVRRSPRHATIVAAAVLGLQLVLGATAGVWAMKKFVYSVGDPNGPGVATRAWIDHADPPQPVGFIARPQPSMTAWQREFMFFNEKFTLPHEVDPVGLARHIERGTGRVRAADVPPSLLYVPETFQPLGLVGREIGRAGYLPGVLLRLSQPIRTAWEVTGPDPDGWLPKGKAVRIKTYARNCVTFNVTAPPDAAVRVALRTRGRPTAARDLGAGETAVMRTTRQGRSTLTASGAGSLPPNRIVGVQVTSIARAACG